MTVTHGDICMIQFMCPLRIMLTKSLSLYFAEDQEWGWDWGDGENQVLPHK